MLIIRAIWRVKIILNIEVNVYKLKYRIREMEINNRPSPFVLVKTGSGIFSPAVPQAGLKNRLPHQYQRLSSLRKERVILDDYIFPVSLIVN